MPQISVLHAILGGLLLAAGTGLLLAGNGRIGGFGGALGTAVTGDAGEEGWRVLFLLGIVAGGLLASEVYPGNFDVTAFDRSYGLLVASGFLMGFGARMCNGCTSGHGICGMARLSPRSLVATGTFFGATLFAVYVGRHVLGLF